MNLLSNKPGATRLVFGAAAIAMAMLAWMWRRWGSSGKYRQIAQLRHAAATVAVAKEVFL